MRKSTQLRWIEQLETRSVQEHAALQRAVSEPDVNITYTTTGPIWSDWLRELARTLRRAVASARSSPVDKPIWDKARFHTAPKLPSTAIDYDRVLVAVLITDIVDSTKRVADMGDRDWRVLLDRHGDATRYQIKRFGGREVGNRGDGFVGLRQQPAPVKPSCPKQSATWWPDRGSFSKTVASTSSAVNRRKSTCTRCAQLCTPPTPTSSI